MLDGVWGGGGVKDAAFKVGLHVAACVLKLSRVSINRSSRLLLREKTWWVSHQRSRADHRLLRGISTDVRILASNGNVGLQIAFGCKPTSPMIGECTPVQQWCAFVSNTRGHIPKSSCLVLSISLPRTRARAADGCTNHAG